MIYKYQILLAVVAYHLLQALGLRVFLLSRLRTLRLRRTKIFIGISKQILSSCLYLPFCGDNQSGRARSNTCVYWYCRRNHVVSIRRASSRSTNEVLCVLCFLACLQTLLHIAKMIMHRGDGPFTIYPAPSTVFLLHTFTTPNTCRTQYSSYAAQKIQDKITAYDSQNQQHLHHLTNQQPCQLAYTHLPPRTTPASTSKT